MIDWAQLRQLEEDVGTEDLGEVVQLFLSEVDEAVAAMVADMPADASELAARMHFLKGSSYNLGFAAFGEYCARGESAALEGDTSTASRAELSSLYEKSKAEFLRDFAAHSAAVLEVA